MQSGRKVLTVRVPVELHREARQLALEQGRSLNSLVESWLRSWVVRYREEGK